MRKRRRDAPETLNEEEEALLKNLDDHDEKRNKVNRWVDKKVEADTTKYSSYVVVSHRLDQTNHFCTLLSIIHTHTPTHIHTHFHTLSHTLSTHTFTHTHTHTPNHKHTHARKQQITHIITNTHTHTHTHINTLTYTHIQTEIFS